MYNYIRELHRQFGTEPDCAIQRTEISSLQSTLKSHLSDEDRKLLLRLTDAQNIIHYETSLENFAAGFKTALGIACEAGAGGRYSYEDAETERICQQVRRTKEEPQLE